MKKRHPIHPGENVGARSTKDDSVPHQQHQRDMTVRAGGRGRTEARRRATPPKTRRSTPR